MLMQKFSRPFLAIIVHDNRLEVRNGMWPFRKKTVLMFKNMASVEVSSYTKQLVITTNDGKERKYAIGGFGKAQKCRDAIVEKL
jgi:hypothetical protein